VGDLLVRQRLHSALVVYNMLRYLQCYSCMEDISAEHLSSIYFR
jgi:hypothetical protein